jgi:hypothetical protein
MEPAQADSSIAAANINTTKMMSLEPPEPAFDASYSPQECQEPMSSCTSMASDSMQLEAIEESLDPLLRFKQSVSKPIPEALLPLPTAHRLDSFTVKPADQGEKKKQKPATLCSPRIKNCNKKRKPAIKLAQEVLAKKWGILNVEEEMEELILQQYIDIYRKPLSQSAMAAVRKLTEVAEMTTKKKLATKKKGSKIKHKTSTARAAYLAT